MANASPDENPLCRAGVSARNHLRSPGAESPAHRRSEDSSSHCRRSSNMVVDILARTVIAHGRVSQVDHRRPRPAGRVVARTLSAGVAGPSNRFDRRFQAQRKRSSPRATGRRIAGAAPWVAPSSGPTSKPAQGIRRLDPHGKVGYVAHNWRLPAGISRTVDDSNYMMSARHCGGREHHASRQGRRVCYVCTFRPGLRRELPSGGLLRANCHERNEKLLRKYPTSLCYSGCSQVCFQGRVKPETSRGCHGCCCSVIFGRGRSRRWCDVYRSRTGESSTAGLSNSR
jgi:hypothetical protein